MLLCSFGAAVFICSAIPNQTWKFQADGTLRVFGWTVVAKAPSWGLALIGVAFFFVVGALGHQLYGCLAVLRSFGNEEGLTLPNRAAWIR